MANPKLYAHQTATVNLGLIATPVLFDTSDPGTGKTLAHLELWATRRRNGGGKLLVICPKTLIESAWIDDIYKFYKGEFTALPSYNTYRAFGFKNNADITVINTDGVKWLTTYTPASLRELLKPYDTIIFDESEAFKHRTSARSKAAAKISKLFTYRNCLSGTPFNRSITELWHQAYLLDGGRRLGGSFFKFRNTVCEAKQVGPLATHVQWEDKDGSEEVVAGILSDISIRHVFEKCVDIPPNKLITKSFTLPPKLQKAYKTMAYESILQLKNDEAVAVNAAVMANKLLQISSGSVYTQEGKAGFIASDRYELILELVKEREHTLVFFEWAHERAELEREATRRGVTYAVIDGSVTQHKRAEIVRRYQAGEIQTIFAQPKSAGHGLTLTKGTRTIWTHPPYSPSVFRQGNGRIYRIGQTENTETIVVIAKDTLEVKIGGILSKRGKRMANLLDLMTF